jgi:aminomethyltransferase
VERLKPLRRTPLFSEHVQLGARLVPFAGWEMPVSYAAGILKEHEAVRTRAGLFDVSHMARLVVEGPEALEVVNRIITNDAARLAPDQLLYSCVCNEQGGVLDDVTVYRRGEGFLVVANAVNHDRMLSWFRQHAGRSTRVEDLTAACAQLALQGPLAAEILGGLLGHDLSERPAYYHYLETRWEGVELLVSRNGYTGEDGFEIYLEANSAPRLWTALLEAGSAAGILPAGLGARDTLRLEMAYCLYGHELDTDTTPLEAGLGWTVRFQKGDFIGRDALLRQKEEGLPKKLVGLRAPGRRIPRPGYELADGTRGVGRVTSGGFAPSLGYPIALAYVDPSHAKAGTRLAMRGHRGEVEVEVVRRPFYTKGSVRSPRKPKADPQGSPDGSRREHGVS